MNDLWDSIEAPIERFTPSIDAAVAPGIGATGHARGELKRKDGFIFARGELSFDGEGITAGEGRWVLSLPAPSLELSVDIPVGRGIHLMSGRALLIGAERFGADLAPQLPLILERLGRDCAVFSYVHPHPIGTLYYLGAEWSHWTLAEGDLLTFDVSYPMNWLVDRPSRLSAS